MDILTVVVTAALSIPHDLALSIALLAGIAVVGCCVIAVLTIEASPAVWVLASEFYYADGELPQDVILPIRRKLD